ncbi:MAG TPA: hypothetical protein VM598_13685 [Bdellovibrionota bacterium]|nr:hypothetical protein [Bdellovibrionota bacterium]
MVRRLTNRILANAGLSGDPEWRRQFILTAKVAAAFHLVAAWYSAGFYQSDEHFQVLEFLQQRLSGADPEGLAVEFHRAMRSWVQPGILYLVSRPFEWVGIENPFHWALAFRLFSAAWGWLATMAMAAASYRFFRDSARRQLVLLLSALLWFLPVLHARPSSENWGGTAFFLGLAWLSLAARGPGPASRVIESAVFGIGGFLFGLAFEFRYQTAFMALGAVAWWIVHGGARTRQLLGLFLGGSLALAIGLLAGRWGYGFWTISPWNYIEFNLIEGRVGASDTGPVWDFFRLTTTETWPGLGIMAFLAYLVACIRSPKHPFVWATLPLVVVHHLIGHKELRFLFPVAHALPVLIPLALERVYPFRNGFVRFASGFLLVWNLVALNTLCLIPAWQGIELYQAIYRDSDRPLFYFGTEDPYLVLGIPLRFYRPPDLETRPAPDELTLRRFPGPFDLIYIAGRSEPSVGLVTDRRCRLIYSRLPDWMRESVFAGLLRNIKDWRLLSCSGEEVDDPPGDARDER